MLRFNKHDFLVWFRIQDDRPAIAEGVRRVLQLGGVIAFPAFWGLMVVAPFAVPLLLGPGWTSVTWPMMAFCFVLPLRLTWMLLARVVVGVGRPELSFRGQIYWLFTVLPALVVGARFGITGVAVAWAVSFPLMFIIVTRTIATALQLPWTDLLTPLVRPAAAAAAMSVLVWVIDAAVAETLPNLLRLLVAALSGGTAYAAVLRLIAPKVFQETLAFVLRFLGGNGRVPRSADA